jgi:hypothetical protein
MMELSSLLFAQLGRNMTLRAWNVQSRAAEKRGPYILEAALTYWATMTLALQINTRTVRECGNLWNVSKRERGKMSTWLESEVSNYCNQKWSRWYVCNITPSIKYGEEALIYS